MTKTMLRWIVIGLLAASPLVGCGDDEAEEAEPTEPVAEEPAAPVEPTAEQVPVPEDFAAEAEQQITAANYQAELETIEAELGEPEEATP